MQFRSSQLAIVAALFTALLTVSAAHAATIQLTGGTLTATAQTQGGALVDQHSTPVSGGLTSYAADAAIQDFVSGGAGTTLQTVATAHIDASTVFGLSVSGFTTGASYMNPQVLGRPSTAMNGAIDFSLTSGQLTAVDFLQSAHPFFSGVSFALTQGGNLVMSCTSNFQCSTAAGSFAQNTVLMLAAGDYHLNISGASELTTGTVINKSFTLSMTPVPLPLSAPLLLSALAGLAGSIRRRVQQ